MRIEHVALWTSQLERLRDFYVGLGGTAGARYHNPRTGLYSYFVSFEDGARLELMQRADVRARPAAASLGLAHFALALGSEAAVNEMALRLGTAGVAVVSQPRRTGDGYYEAVIQDPDGNLVELTA